MVSTMDIYQEGIELLSSFIQPEMATKISSYNLMSSSHQIISNSSTFCTRQSSSINNDRWSELFDYMIGNTWFILNKLRYLFYLVWPTETMFDGLGNVPRYVAEMFPVFFIAALLENAIRLLQGKTVVRINETVGSLSQGIFQECLRIKVRSIEVLMYCLVYENFRIVSLPWNSLWTWWLCYLAVDIGFYWAHRLAHEVNFIWAIHQAHHSSEEFSIVSALRQAVLQPFTAWLSELYMAWLHTEIVDSIGPLEYILNTPSHHRVHHSRNPEYIDKNYGGMLIIWDRLFDTFKKEDKSNPPVYGLVHQVESFNPMTVQFHTWPVIWKRIGNAKTIHDKLAIIFYGPGWIPGQTRLGDTTRLPKIMRPIKCYDPQISTWLNAYVVTHFALILFLYHELTLFHYEFNTFIINIGVLALITSITTLGLILDNKMRYNAIFELSRCLLFFSARSTLFPIIVHGLQRAGLNYTNQIILMFFIHALFTLSTLLMIIQILSRLLTDIKLWEKLYSVGFLTGSFKKLTSSKIV